MKPVRGSSRAPSKTPKSKEKKRIDEKTGRKTANGQQAEPSNADKIIPSKPPTKTKGASATSRKVRGQEKWIPMPKASITALEKLLEPSILSVLLVKRKDKEETQKHLNTLKKRFLTECEQLKVPDQKQKGFTHSSRQHLEETKKSLVGEKTLGKLKKDKSTVVSSLWEEEERLKTLGSKCRKLRECLEVEEKKAMEISKISDQGVLSLPILPSLQHSEATLQDHMMTMVPNTESEATARRLGNILQKSDAIKSAKALLVPAEQFTDQVVTPAHSV